MTDKISCHLVVIRGKFHVDFKYIERWDSISIFGATTETYIHTYTNIRTRVKLRSPPPKGGVLKIQVSAILPEKNLHAKGQTRRNARRLFENVTKEIGQTRPLCFISLASAVQSVDWTTFCLNYIVAVTIWRGEGGLFQTLLTEVVSERQGGECKQTEQNFHTRSPYTWCVHRTLRLCTW